MRGLHCFVLRQHPTRRRHKLGSYITQACKYIQTIYLIDVNVKCKRNEFPSCEIQLGNGCLALCICVLRCVSLLTQTPLCGPRR